MKLNTNRLVEWQIKCTEKIISEMEDKSTENIQTKVWREIKMYNTYKSNIHVIQVLVDMRERMNKSNIKK